MQLTLAEHIAQFTPKAKFREKKFVKFLRKQRRTVKHKPDNNKQRANA